MVRPPILTRPQLAGLLFCPALYVALLLLLIEALLSATTTYFLIKIARDIATNDFLAYNLLYIFLAQSASYLFGAMSWVFSEMAGCRAFGLYMLRFARSNRHEVKLLNEKSTRERIEPFLTGEAFYAIFNMMYEVQSQIHLFLGLVFNSLILGAEIDKALPIAYLSVFIILATLQWSVRHRVARAYLLNQKMENRITAQGYTAWDNIMSGNRYNFRLWFREFKSRLRKNLQVEIRAIAWREGLSSGGGIIGLLVVFSTTVIIASQDQENISLLIALAVTVPRQIDMAVDVHSFASGWNDVLMHWTRWKGFVMNVHPEPDPRFESRIQMHRLILREGDRIRECNSVDDALRILLGKPTGRINLRGGNASGKSTLLASLKARIKNHSYYWPTADRLAFSFEREALHAAGDDDGEGTLEEEIAARENHSKNGFSSGERMLQVLKEIIANTDDAIYLLDEWDANLDAAHRAEADKLVDTLAARARVIEISHRDRDFAPK